MIEREFIKEKIRNLSIKEFIDVTLRKEASVGSIRIDKTPLGEKITIATTRPGMVIGRAGQTIKSLTSDLRSKFRLENPQINTLEIPDVSASAATVAKKIASELERFGPRRFKGTGYRELSNIMRSGALGAEIMISGKVTGKRARPWRFAEGYMKKCGNISDEYLDHGYEIAVLKAGAVGVQVTIMHSNTPLPDKIAIVDPQKEEVSVKETPELEDIKAGEKPVEEVKPKSKAKPVEKSKAAPKKATAKKPAAKASPKKTPAKKIGVKNKDGNTDAVSSAIQNNKKGAKNKDGNTEAKRNKKASK